MRRNLIKEYNPYINVCRTGIRFRIYSDTPALLSYTSNCSNPCSYAYRRLTALEIFRFKHSCLPDDGCNRPSRILGGCCRPWHNYGKDGGLPDRIFSRSCLNIGTEGQKPGLSETSSSLCGRGYSHGIFWGSAVVELCYQNRNLKVDYRWRTPFYSRRFTQNHSCRIYYLKA